MGRVGQTVKGKLGLGFALTLALLGILSVVSIAAVRTMAHDTTQIYYTHLQSITALDQASRQLGRLHDVIKGHLNAAREPDLVALAQQIPEIRTQLDQAWQSYYPLHVSTVTERKRARNGQDKLDALDAALGQLATMARDKRFYAGLDYYNNTLAKRLMALSNIVDQLRRIHVQFARAVYLRTARSQVRLQWAILGAAGAALAIALLMAVLLTRMITRPLGKARTFADSIARGRLDNPIEHPAKDEFGAMIASLAVMQQQLANTVSTAEQAKNALYASNTELEATNRQLVRTEALYRELFVRNPLPLYVVDRQTLRFLEVNETAQSHYGFERAEFLRMTLRDIEPFSAFETANRRRAELGPDQTNAGLWCHVTRAGRAIDVELSMYVVQWVEQPAWLIVAHDVTAQRQAQQTLELRNQAIEASHNGMFICSARDDGAGAICYVNAAMARFSGQAPEALIGRPLTDLFPHDAAKDANHLVPALQSGRQAEAVIAIQSEDRDARWLAVQVTPVPDEQGETSYWIGVVQDITERKVFEATLAYRADHDDLTGLPNRDTLHQRLDDAITAAAHTGREVAVIFLDLDGFKQINDTGGHKVGDIYLQTIAKRLASRIRDTDTLARVGGDEFVLVAVGPHLAETLPDRALRLQEAFIEPVTIAEQAFITHCSIGIACYPAHGTDAETLLRRADLTMYTAKHNGGQAIEWFSEAMENRFRQRGVIEAALQHALIHEEFELHYQPQIDMRQGVVVGLEALLRWPSADAAYRSPADFIPVAEETGLIGAIGAWVLGQACTDLARLRAMGYDTLTMAVNASAVELRNADYAAHVSALLAAHELPAHALEIEITESVFMTEHEQSINTLHALEAIGVHLAIDDFGTGYSSLSYLSRLPIHRLKIDRSFISQMNASTRASELVRAVASMADSLELETVAEGVETEAEQRTLLSYNCVLAQGFYYSRGVPIATLVEQLDKPAAWATAV